MKDDITFKIIKFIVIVSCICGIGFRIAIPEEYINYYMAGINVLSFLVTINLFLMECYTKLKREYHIVKENLNVIRKKRAEEGIMKYYLSIYLINSILIAILIYFYFFSLKGKIDVLNDVLGIVSLGMAISSDLIVEITVGILMWKFEREK